MANFEQNRTSHPIEAVRQNVFERYKQYREAKRIKLEDLRGVYGDDELRRDAEKVGARRSGFDAASTDNIGMVAEVAFHKNINGGARIFGERARATLLSEYDDYGLSDSESREERGAWSDAVVELFPPEPPMEKGVMAPYNFVMGVDVTTNIMEKALELKLRGVKSGLDTGRLATVKYFKSDEPQFNHHYAGRLLKVPRAVIVTDADTAWRVAELTDKVEKGQTPARALLQKDPFALVSLAELVVQFEASREYAKRVTRDTETEHKFDDGLARLKRILNEKGITKEGLSNRAVVSNSSFRAFGSALIKLGFQVRSPAEIL